MSLFTALKEKIEKKEAIVGMVGIGFVGFNLAEVIANEGFSVIGFDLIKDKVEKVENSKIKNFHATQDFAKLASVDIIIVTVPTLITKEKHPNLKILQDAAEQIHRYLQDGQLIILESTVAPGMTREIFLPILKNATSKNFFVGYSPERIDPGNSKFTIKNTPKIISGIDENSLILMQTFYERVVDKPIVVSSIEVAEFAKMLENVVRFMNINLMNEMENYAVKKGINLWEVIDAAATKPFGYFPYYPGPGISGHCIPVNLFYLLDDAYKLGINCALLKHAAKFHEERIEKIVDTAFQIAQKKNPKICILGVAVKPGSDSSQESVGLKMLELIEKKGGVPSYHDPFIPEIAKFTSNPFTNAFLEKQDLFIIVTAHKEIDFVELLSYDKPILDTKNIYKEKRPNIIRV